MMQIIIHHQPIRHMTHTTLAHPAHAQSGLAWNLSWPVTVQHVMTIVT